MATLKAIKHFEVYLLVRKFILRTDNLSIRWLQTLRHPEQQLFRWITILQSFSYVVFHRSGKLHLNADSLSRRPCDPKCKHCKRKEENETKEEDDLDIVHAYSVSSPFNLNARPSSVTLETKLAHIQSNDQVLKARSMSNHSETPDPWTPENLGYAQRTDPELESIYEAVNQGKRPPPETFATYSGPT